MPPEPQTVPTYDSDGIAIRIPVPSIPDQGQEVRRRQDLNLRPNFSGDSLARSWFQPLTHVSNVQKDLGLPFVDPRKTAMSRTCSGVRSLPSWC